MKENNKVIDNITTMIFKESHNNRNYDQIASLYENQLLRSPNEEQLRVNLNKYPAAGAWHNRQLIGFCYTTRFCPDILEIANILVHQNYRNKDIGSKLLKLVEEEALNTNFAATILINSDLYSTGVTPSRPATNFYLTQGYNLVGSTKESRVFFKNLK